MIDFIHDWVIPITIILLAMAALAIVFACATVGPVWLLEVVFG